jgi:hypothetical protein
MFHRHGHPSGQIQQGREDVGAQQGPDTLAAFVRNSEGCEDTINPFEVAATAVRSKKK